MGKEATKANVLSEISHVEIFYAACHAVGDISNPLNSGLLLASTNTPLGNNASVVDSSMQDQGTRSLDTSADDMERGKLTAAEIFGVDMKDTKLVVLSGCETAVGRARSGEDAVSLSRAFQYAGAPKVLASQWKVDDKATEALMTTFYDGVSQTSAAQALQKAQLEIIASGKNSPFYWAAWGISGDGRGSIQTSAPGETSGKTSTSRAATPQKMSN